MTETIEQQPKYHPSFTDGDLLVIANDHTHFAAQCERLARGSQVFKNMVDLPKPACGVNGDSTGHSEVRREENVIDWMSTPNLLDPFSLSSFEASDEHISLVRERLLEESKGKLWQLLAFASKLDDRKFGLITLKKMDLASFSRGRDPGDEHDRLSFVSQMSDLSPAWQGKLYSLALKDEKVTVNRLAWVARVSKKGRDYTTRDWEPIPVPGLTFVDSWERICNGFASDKQLQCYNISSSLLKYVKVGLNAHNRT
ncbi:hypothetical protein V865_007175 [Kwoniella europaea PYCC6329]|uniref:BTB domain-containing protein n=1 Tax=Kwoniella europaea PYCC6329 TaxID=1423913 RepID=A0AAX4KU01_9TREE